LIFFHFETFKWVDTSIFAYGSFEVITFVLWDSGLTKSFWVVS
jgi:hypothetical protein